MFYVMLLMKPAVELGKSLHFCQMDWCVGQYCDSNFAIYTSVPVVNCTTSGGFLHGSVSANQTSFSKVISYRCNTGYAIKGAATQAADLKCEADGTWNGTEPVCSGKVH